jgi:predicted lipoprotein with Yx(FWY)xxD motif
MRGTSRRVTSERRRARLYWRRGLYLAPVLTAAGALAAVTAQALASDASATAAAVQVKSATVGKYGKILVTSSGLALYYDTANKPGKWACTGDCLTAWPPLLLPKGQMKVTAAPGITGLSAVKGPSGMQVTWKNKPLYTYIKDSKGQVKGQGLFKVWYVVQLSASTTATTKGSSWA